jgi:hypothetical protein
MGNRQTLRLKQTGAWWRWPPAAIGDKRREDSMRFRHYKGGMYELVCEATLESDLTPMVVYRAADGTTWCRPKAVFNELVEVDGHMIPRFAPIN